MMRKEKNQAKKSFMYAVDERITATILPIIANSGHPGSTVQFVGCVYWDWCNWALTLHHEQ